MTMQLYKKKPCLALTLKQKILFLTYNLLFFVDFFAFLGLIFFWGKGGNNASYFVDV